MEAEVEADLLLSLRLHLEGVAIALRKNDLEFEGEDATIRSALPILLTLIRSFCLRKLPRTIP